MNDPQNAPYAPPENVLRALERVHKNGLKGKIDGEFLEQLGIGDGMTQRTMRALEFIGFTKPDDEGAPTPLMEQYIVSGDDDAKALLAEAIRKSYEMIFRAVNPETDDRNKVLVAFKPMKPQGQWNRMVTLFLGLCQAAGMAVKEPPSTRTGKNSATKPQRKERAKSAARPDAPSRTSAPASQTTIHSPSSRALDPALVGIIGKVADLETAEDLDAWITMFRAAFHFVKKIKI